MFKLIEKSAAGEAAPVELTIDGTVAHAPPGQMLAITLLMAGVHPFRLTAVSGEPRAPLCLMGVCFDCLVNLDGTANVQSCMVETCAGMKVRLQKGAPTYGGES